ncbi:cyclic nucleotide-binding domain-containing protein [Colwelliaceae bacterium 6471]
MGEITKLKLMEIANRIPLFKALSLHEKEKVITINNIVKVIKKDTKFIIYGDHDDSFYILLNGSAAVYKNDRKIATLNGGQFVGEVGFICREPSTSSVVAETDLITFFFTRDRFLNLPVSLREKIKDGLIGGLVNKIHGMNDEIEGLRQFIDSLEEETEKQAKAPVSEINLKKLKSS